jgi:porin
MKRYFISLIAVMLQLTNTYAQNEFPVKFESNARFDFIGVHNHDNRNYALMHGEADIAASVLSDNLGLFKGGELYVQTMGTFGSQASENYTGDLQVFSNIESETRIFLYQCYYKQTFNKFIIKLGQLDMNADYLVSSWAAPMVNSSFGVIPTISLNMPASIFAYLSPGISFKYLYSKQLTIQTAFFDGNPGGLESNPHNLNWHIGNDDGWFNITELHYKTKSNLRLGRYKTGIFYHSKSTTNPENVASSKQSFGFFVIGDQQLTFEKNTLKNGLSMFFQLSYSLASQNMIRRYSSLGLMYRGIFPQMNEDEFTFSLASVSLGSDFLKSNPDFYNSETAIEITYKKYLTPTVIIQPDFQYIIQPGANKLYTGNVTVGLLRTILTF